MPNAVNKLASKLVVPCFKIPLMICINWSALYTDPDVQRQVIGIINREFGNEIAYKEQVRFICACSSTVVSAERWAVRFECWLLWIGYALLPGITIDNICM